MPSLDYNGLTVEYTQSGSGSDLLLIHSLLTEMSVYDKVLPDLSSQHRVTTLNLPGFGASSPAELNGLAAVADHLAGVMAALKLPSTTDVFGNGFGAFVVLQLAIDHGDKFRRLLVADCVPAFPEAGRAPFRGMAQKVRGEGMGAVLDAAIGRMFPPTYQQAEPAVVKERKERLAKVDAQCFARACEALAQMDLSPRLPSVKNPTRVMCGALDQTTVPALAMEVARLIPGAEYREIVNSGHCPMLEQPDDLVRLINEFIAPR